MISVSCSQCSASFTVDDVHAGKTGKCRRCGSVVSIPPQHSPYADEGREPTPSHIVQEPPSIDDDEDTASLGRLHVTTTDTIQGWVIDQYKGLVTAHVVAGTGFFSDFAAGITDIFGGRSETYQSQLASIQKDAFQVLYDKALEKAANWIIGVRVDFDEISGKGVQMFMVSVQGTAVQARQLPQTPEAHEVTSLSGAAVQQQLRKVAVLKQLQQIVSGERPWSEALLHSICDTQAYEALPLILDILTVDAREADQPFPPAVQSLALQAFRMAPKRESRELIQRKLLTDGPNQRLLALYGRLNLLSMSWVLEQLRSPTWEHRRVGLRAFCVGVAASYKPADISLLEQIRDALPAAFPDCSEVVTVKGLLGAGTYWRCRHGHDNQLDVTHCHACTESRFGLRRGESSPEKGLEIAETTLAMLKQHLPSS